METTNETTKKCPMPHWMRWPAMLLFLAFLIEGLLWIGAFVLGYQVLN